MGGKPALKNCPCCNSTAKIIEPLRGLFGVCQVVCSGCGLNSRMTPTPEEAVEVWNNRKPLETLVDQIREKAIEANKKMQLSDSALIFNYSGRWAAFTEAADLIKEV